MLNWKEVASSNIRTFLLEDDPELLHIITLRYDDLYAVFYENAYETEPWLTGLRVLTQKQIKEKFNIEL